MQEEYQREQAFASSRFADLAEQITTLQTAAATTSNKAMTMACPMEQKADKFYAVAKGYSPGIYIKLKVSQMH
jgi:hypothetical protein